MTLEEYKTTCSEVLVGLLLEQLYLPKRGKADTRCPASYSSRLRQLYRGRSISHGRVII